MTSAPSHENNDTYNKNQDIANLLLDETAPQKTQPVWLATPGTLAQDLDRMTKEQRAWLHANDWQPRAGSHCVLPGPDGHVAGVVLGMGPADSFHNNPMLTGLLPDVIPNGYYHFESELENAELSTIAWLLGAYRFSNYSARHAKRPRWLRLPAGVDRARVVRIAQSVKLGRDLINTPAEDLGPEQLGAAVEALAADYGAQVTQIVGDDLLAQNFPLIHAVGRASDRAPRLIDLRWGDERAPKLTLVGKGITYDTGGLNLKPGNSMLLMKKDMGGAAAVISLARMIMDAGLDVRLRVLIPSADNNVSSNSFRPGDVFKSRKGLTVEIGNTDAEGRLVLADALALADEEAPDHLICMATLTGAARVAMGPDLVPFHSTNDKFSKTLIDHAARTHDYLWEMPFWPPYNKMLNSKIADLSHISETPFAGSLVAALFLRRFVHQAERFAHFDIYGWVPQKRPGRPVGGEPQGARALYDYFAAQFTAAG